MHVCFSEESCFQSKVEIKLGFMSNGRLQMFLEKHRDEDIKHSVMATLLPAQHTGYSNIQSTANPLNEFEVYEQVKIAEKLNEFFLETA